MLLSRQGSNFQRRQGTYRSSCADSLQPGILSAKLLRPGNSTFARRLHPSNVLVPTSEGEGLWFRRDNRGVLDSTGVLKYGAISQIGNAERGISIIMRPPRH